LVAAIILAGHPQTRFHGYMKNIFNPRFGLLLAGIILLVGGIIFAGKHRAATVHEHHLITPTLTYALPPDGRELVLPASTLETNVSLWFDPVREIHDDGMTYASVLFQSQLGDAAAAYDRMEKPVTGENFQFPSMNLADKSVNYSLFSIGKFSASFSLTPILASPQAIIPTEIKPGLGGSFNF
jgi:hypothetical protein